MKPTSIPKEARKWIEELFCWFQVLRQHFMFLSFCIHLYASSFMFLSFACILPSFCSHFLSSSFHVPFICVHFHSFSFHIPFILKIPMCIHVLSSSYICTHTHTHAHVYIYIYILYIHNLHECTILATLAQSKLGNYWGQ